MPAQHGFAQRLRRDPRCRARRQLRAVPHRALRDDATLPTRHQRSGNDVHHHQRPRPCHRRDDAARCQPRSVAGAGAQSRRPERPRRDAVASDAALRLRTARAPRTSRRDSGGQPWRRRRRVWELGRGSSGDSRRRRERAVRDGGRTSGPPGRDRHLQRAARLPPTRPRRSSARHHRGVLGAVVGAAHVRRPLARCRRAERAGAEAARLRTIRRHHGRADHVAAGGDRRRAQLGLPLLLDP